MRKKLLSVVYLLGFLVSIVVMVVLVNDSWESLMLHWRGDTAEATVVQPIRKSRVQVQFTDASGKAQQAVIRRPSRLLRGAKSAPETYTIKYATEYPGSAVVCEWHAILEVWLLKGVAFIMLLLLFFATFPYSWFRRKTK